MIERPDVHLKSSAAGWQKIFGVFCGISIILLFGFYTVQFIYNNPSDARVLKALLLFGVVVLIVGSYTKNLYYTVFATDRGLETEAIIGANQLMLWEDIIAIRRPRFGFPANSTYVISKQGDKLILIKSHSRYKELVQYIVQHAPNLEMR
jgi:hypothetical protein